MQRVTIIVEGRRFFFEVIVNEAVFMMLNRNLKWSSKYDNCGCVIIIDLPIFESTDPIIFSLRQFCYHLEDNFCLIFSLMSAIDSRPNMNFVPLYAHRWKYYSWFLKQNLLYSDAFKIESGRGLRRHSREIYKKLNERMNILTGCDIDNSWMGDVISSKKQAHFVFPRFWRWSAAYFMFGKIIQFSCVQFFLCFLKTNPNPFTGPLASFGRISRTIYRRLPSLKHCQKLLSSNFP